MVGDTGNDDGPKKRGRKAVIKTDKPMPKPKGRPQTIQSVPPPVLHQEGASSGSGGNAIIEIPPPVNVEATVQQNETKPIPPPKPPPPKQKPT